MANFRYKGRQKGKTVSGQIEAHDSQHVAKELLAQGITPIQITEGKSASAEKSGKRFDMNAELSIFQPNPTIADLIIFCRQMYSLSKSGVPIIRSIRGLGQTSRNPKLAQALKEVSDNLEGGRTLAQSLARHPKIFPSVMLSIVSVGENAGRLDQAFQQLAAYLELERDTRDRVKGAMRYPVIVITAIVVAIVVINMVVIPAFAKVFESFGADLPWATQVLLATSAFTMDYWPFLLAGLVGSGFAISSWVKTPKGRQTWDQYKLKMPVVGDVIRRATLARFARSFSMSLSAGVPLMQAITLVSRSVENAWMEQKILDMRSGIERGESLMRVATASELFTPLVLQMLSVGEETGQVDTLLEEVAEYYEREVEYDLKNLSSAIEPILIVIIGIMVLILALGVFLPMWELGGAAR